MDYQVAYANVIVWQSIMWQQQYRLSGGMWQQQYRLRGNGGGGGGDIGGESGISLETMNPGQPTAVAVDIPVGTMNPVQPTAVAVAVPIPAIKTWEVSASNTTQQGHSVGDLVLVAGDITSTALQNCALIFQNEVLEMRRQQKASGGLQEEATTFTHTAPLGLCDFPCSLLKAPIMCCAYGRCVNPLAVFGDVDVLTVTNARAGLSTPVTSVTLRNNFLNTSITLTPCKTTYTELTAMATACV
jgi:hypothetical protein